MHIIREWEQERVWKRRAWFALAVLDAAIWWLIISVGVAIYRWFGR